MPSATYINKAKSYAIHIVNAKMKYMDAGIVLPKHIDRQLVAFSFYEQAVYIEDTLGASIANRIHNIIDEAIAVANIGTAQIYTFNSHSYMNYAITPPTERKDLFNKIVADLATSGRRVLEDCTAGCSEWNNTSYALYNMFLSAMSAAAIGDTVASNIMYEYISNKLSNR